MAGMTRGDTERELKAAVSVLAMAEEMRRDCEEKIARLDAGIGALRELIFVLDIEQKGAES